ncbi:hypothetical protein PHYPSEUDO_013838 [Phytophthora pseudosyringae]|uniref:Uncharacterized protein n=1 Tax=Phytophthora pseudosyringae TaxID=221518 RepID=A0A8T1W309_9STRA|nr:hypothetical protein PHYPSEUDO_013838 [Phytophthora pseudosyringae]
MVKLTVTIAAAVAAAAVLVEGSSAPGSPLSPHSQFLRDGRSASSDLGLGSQHSDADLPPPHDFSRDLAPPAGSKSGDKLRSGHRHHSPPDAGFVDLPFDGSGNGRRPWPGRGSLDGRIKPTFAGHDQGDADREHSDHDAPDGRDFPPPPGPNDAKPMLPTQEGGRGKRDDPLSEFGKRDGKQPRVVGSGGDKQLPSPMRDEGQLRTDQPPADSKIVGSAPSPLGSNEHGSWHGSGSFDGHVPSPSNAGENPPAPKGGRDPKNDVKPDGRNPPPSSGIGAASGEPAPPAEMPQ